eukprot:1141217_1
MDDGKPLRSLYVILCNIELRIGCGREEGTPCISFDAGDLTGVYFKLVDNLFVNNGGLPIGYYYRFRYYVSYVNKNKPIFEGNRVKRRNEVGNDDTLWFFID